MDQQTQPVYEFLGFQLDVGQRVLTRGGNLIALTPKAFDVLLFLVQNSGRVLDKDELMKAIWPDSFVEEGNLSQNIFVLRKILGDTHGDSPIQTIPRRGYKFVGSVKQLDVPASTGNANGSADSFLSAEYWSAHSPFRGLRIFEPDDAWLFFGRDSETEDLLSRLGRSSTMAVIGNSGCGKSSLIRAGLIPALRAGRFCYGEIPVDSWRVAIVRPSEAPFDYLAEVLPTQLAPELSLREQVDFVADCRNKLPVGGEALRNAISVLANAAATRESHHARILLVVDQFEELFTLTAKHDVRQRYIDALLAAGRWDSYVSIHVLLLLRADFYSHCLEYPGLSRCLEMNLYNVPRMTHDQLRKNIEKRLALAGAHAEPGLIDSLLDDVGSEPGDLALLEHALTQLWERCGGFGCTLTNTAYTVIGRLRGALSAHADQVCGAITDAAQQHLAQRIFLELVHLGEGAPDTRRRIRKQELLSLGLPEEVEPLLARLTASRLITMGGVGRETFAEVSHEALIREWSTLREWITQNREELQLERRLGQAAQEWESLNRDTGALLQGARLAQSEDWLVRHPAALAPLREFIQASVAVRAEIEERELRKQKIAATRLRRFSFILVVLLFVALIAMWAVHSHQVLAESQALLAQSEAMLTRDPGQALNLAVRSWNMSRTQETYIALTKALPQTLSILNHDNRVLNAVFSPDGQRILTASEDNTARMWNTADGRLLAVLSGHLDRVHCAIFSPEGQRILTTSDDHTARIWNTADGTLEAILKGHTREVRSAAFSSNGLHILTASYDETVRIWNTAGRLLGVIHSGNSIQSAAFSPDGQRIVTASANPASPTVQVWRTADSHLLATLRGHTNSINYAEFSPDGQRIVTASSDNTARVWNALDGRLLVTVYHDGGVWHATFSPDGRRIVTASYDHTARVWNTADGHLLATLHHEGRVAHVCFSPDGLRIITASYDHTARVWNTADGRLLATLQGHTDVVWKVLSSPDGRRILTASFDHTVRIWNIAGGYLLSTLQGHTDRIITGTFSPDGQSIVTASGDHTARIWNANQGQLRATLRGHTDIVLTAVFSPDGRHIVTASFDHTARIWSADDGRLLAILQGHTGAVNHAKFSPDGQRIVTAGADHTARIWNTADGRLLTILQGHTDAVKHAEFSPDGQRIVTAGADHTARVWSTADGLLMATLQGHTDVVIGATFSPDSQRIVTASRDHTARIWNAADGHLLATLQGHTSAVWMPTFSPDGQRIMTCSTDHTARIWDSTDGHLLFTLQGHTDRVFFATFSPDGQRIVTASDDHTARVWNAADGHLLAALQGHSDAVWSAMFSPDGQYILTTSHDLTARIWRVLTLDDIPKILVQQ
jgi:WD40 repeat protein/DNA-binding winged helix-turn-helix (wHTH) protein